MDSTESGVAPPKLRTSCDACLAAKVKCDKTQRPCRRCANQGIPCNFGLSQRCGNQQSSRKSGAAAKKSTSGARQKDSGPAPAAALKPIPQQEPQNVEMLPMQELNTIWNSVLTESVPNGDHALDHFVLNSPVSRPGFDTPALSAEYLGAGDCMDPSRQNMNQLINALHTPLSHLNPGNSAMLHLNSESDLNACFNGLSTSPQHQHHKLGSPDAGLHHGNDGSVSNLMMSLLDASPSSFNDSIEENTRAVVMVRQILDSSESPDHDVALLAMAIIYRALGQATNLGTAGKNPSSSNSLDSLLQNWIEVDEPNQEWEERDLELMMQRIGLLHEIHLAASHFDRLALQNPAIPHMEEFNQIVLKLSKTLKGRLAGAMSDVVSHSTRSSSVAAD